MIHNSHVSQFIPPNLCHFVTGTWTDAAGAVANTIVKSKAAADQTAIVTIPIMIPSNSVALQGAKLVSVDVWWEVLTAAMDAVSALVHLATLPADTAAFGAPAAQTFTYDTGHNTAAARLTLEQHKMTLTITTPPWLDDDQIMLVQLTYDAAATSLLTFFGARANYTLRV